jgi:4a-hydroxytetrahydrobiopterin dehydratase
MKSDLAKRQCKPCECGTPPLKGEVLRQMQNRLNGNWQIVDDQSLLKHFKFPDFGHALKFTNRVGEIAEEQNHHPEIYLTYGEVGIQISTLSVGGLTENDFILAAKINALD